MKRIASLGAAAALLTLGTALLAQDPPQNPAQGPPPKTFTLVLQGAI